VISGIKITKKRIIIPQIMQRVISALNERGKLHFLTLIRQKRSTSGQQINDNTPKTRIYTKKIQKNHEQARNRKKKKKIRMFLSVGFIVRGDSYYKPNSIFCNSLKIEIAVTRHGVSEHQYVILSDTFLIIMPLCPFYNFGTEFENR